MRRARNRRGERGRARVARGSRAAALGGVLLLAGLTILLLGRGPGASRAVADAGTAGAPTAGDSFQPQLGLPASHVVAFGGSPGEASGEAWAYGYVGAAPVQVGGESYANQYVLLERPGDTQLWQAVPLPTGPEGKPLAEGESGGPATYGVLAGQATQAGGVVLLSGQNIVVRDPRGQPRLAPTPAQAHTETGGSGIGGPGGAGEGSEKEAVVLEPGESLLPTGASGAVTVPYAATEEPENRTGLLIAPYHDGGKLSDEDEPELPLGVLHYDGGEGSGAWAREPIEADKEEKQRFTPLAIACSGTTSEPDGSSGEDCWLLAGYGEGATLEHLALFRRAHGSEGSGWVWKRQPVGGWLLGREAPPSGVSRVSVAPLAQGAQMLTATAQGVWVDLQMRLNGEAEAVDVTQYIADPGGESGGEQAMVDGTWCYPDPTTSGVCSGSLGGSFPLGYRSFAWPGGSSAEPGTRVVSGLEYGAMLEFSGGAFKYEIGGGGHPSGGAALYRSSSGAPVEGVVAYDADYTGADEEGESPLVALTASPGAPTGPSAVATDGLSGDQFHEEAVPFRHPLLAVAQAPGTTPGDPSAPALAVGLDGQVGRYVPGSGWQPEALYDAAGVAQTPDLRGVAWPEPNRAYAVGDKGEMWLWMQELGYWIPDPAKPFNFIGNLTAIAFDQSEPSLGFAVGKQGVLLKYGKSWEEITQQAIKREAGRLEGEVGMEESRLDFTSVEFAGGEALAGYRYVTKEPGAGGGEIEVEAGGVLVYNEEGVCVQEDEEIEREKHVQVPSGERGCWHVSASASALLAGMHSPEATVISKVAGLPGGGAVAAGPDVVMEREPGSSTWQLAPVPLTGAYDISALAAYSEGGHVRAVASIDLDRHIDPNGVGVLDRGPYAGDVTPPSAPGEPRPFVPADPLPDSGYVLKQTASGWEDMEHMALPVTGNQSDLPARPEPVFALLVSPGGEQGIAVGGQTYDEGGFGPEEKGDTASAQRFPAAAAHAQTSEAPLAAPPGAATFIVGGEAECQEGCANLANQAIGPDVWLSHALQTASRVEGARAFLYVGKRSTDSEPERDRFEQLLEAAGPRLPVYVEPLTFGMPLTRNAGAVTPCAQAAVHCAAGTTAYSFTSTGATGGQVRVIMLDYLRGAHGPELGESQRAWLASELQAAKGHEPSIVVGRDALGFTLPVQDGSVAEQATDAPQVSQILVQGEASAYIFDYPSVNIQASVVSPSGARLPAFGTGTLGAVEADTGEEGTTNTLHSSGFLEVSVDTAARGKDREAPGQPNRAPVEASAIPNDGELAIDATNGALLRRSQDALFEGLARRPLAGIEAGGGNSKEGTIVFPRAYDPIPTDCQGANCAYEVPLQYTFTSSEPDVGAFVLHESSSKDPRQVLLNARHEPIPDEPRDTRHELIAGGRFEERENSAGAREALNENGEPIPRESSALFCAYNEGTTTITISAGGLSYSMPIHVQGGSAEYPCGTVPLKNPPPRIEPGSPFFAIPSLAAATPTSPSPTPQVLPTPVPPPPPPAAHPAPKPRPRHTPPVYPFLPAAAGLALLRPIIVPPPLSPVEPTPPSGTSSVQVYQNAVAPEREREEEAAMDIVHNMSAHTPDPRPSVAGAHGGGDPTPGVALVAAYTHDPGNPLTPYLPAAILLLAVVGAGLYDVRVRRGLKLARSGSRRQS